jgi:hypothetical protein
VCTALPLFTLLRSSPPESYATRRISIAEFVRRAVCEAVPANGQAPWMKFAGLMETGDPTLSRSIDELVYGQKD